MFRNHYPWEEKKYTVLAAVGARAYYIRRRLIPQASVATHVLRYQHEIPGKDTRIIFNKYTD